MTWSAFWLARARAFRNGVFRARNGAARGLLLWWLMAVTFGAMVFASLWLYFSALAPAGGAPSAATTGLLALLLDAALLGVLVFDLHFAISALLLDSDLALLRVAPLPAGRLLAAKLLDAAAYTPTMLVALAAPAMLAYLMTQGARGGSYALAAAGLVGLWALAVGPGTLIALLLARRLEARRLRVLLSLAGTMILATLWIANGFLAPRLVKPEEALALDLIPLAEARAQALGISPGGWVAGALQAAAAGRTATALLWTLLLLGTAALALWAAARWGSARMAEAQAAAQIRPGRRYPRPAAAGAAPASLAGAVAGKDLRQIARDWSVLGDLVTSSLLWALLPLIATPLLPGRPEITLAAALVVLACGLGYEVAARLVPLERDGFAVFLASPAPRARWLLAKLVAGAGISATLLGVTGLVLAGGLRVPAGAALVALGWAGLALLGAIGLGLALGLRYADFAWVNPRAMLLPAGRGWSAVALVLQATLWLLLWSLGRGPRAATSGALELPASPPWLPGVAIAVVIATLALIESARRLARHEWRS